MKGSGFIWMIGMIGFVMFGLFWIIFGSGFNSVTAMGDSFITSTEGITVWNIVKSVITNWPIIILIMIVIFVLVNSQKSSGGEGF